MLGRERWGKGLCFLPTAGCSPCRAALGGPDRSASGRSPPPHPCSAWAPAGWAPVVLLQRKAAPALSECPGWVTGAHSWVSERLYAGPKEMPLPVLFTDADLHSPAQSRTP
ncbi:uncharacterized protein RHO17_020787 [Thomomys bottae]